MSEISGVLAKALNHARGEAKALEDALAAEIGVMGVAGRKAGEFQRTVIEVAAPLADQVEIEDVVQFMVDYARQSPRKDAVMEAAEILRTGRFLPVRLP